MPRPLGPNEVHVHYALTASLGDVAAEPEDVLSVEESARAARFVRPRDRLTYVVAHGLLRRTLSRYADVDPREWVFDEGEHGKPRLAARHAPALAFNLTHADGLVACVIGSPGRAIGIDAEPIDRRVMDLMAIARRFFSPSEVASLEGRALERRQLLFVELWTLKEAYVKAVGQGLSHGFESFGFEIDDRGGLVFRTQHADSRAWQFRLYAPTDRHRLAVAAGGHDLGDVDVSVWTEGTPSDVCRLLATGSSPPSH
jgi:4'-phosphopantetheinyl transferase